MVILDNVKDINCNLDYGISASKPMANNCEIIWGKNKNNIQHRKVDLTQIRLSDMKSEETKYNTHYTNAYMNISFADYPAKCKLEVVKGSNNKHHSLDCE